MSILFDGPVRVYLQGKKALLPIDVTKEQVTYWIGSEQTKLLLRDHRCQSIDAAVRVLMGENGFEFADIFNQSSFAKVKIEYGTVNIELFEITTEGDYPILWLGVLDDNMIPNYRTEWEYLRPVDSQSTAVSVLLKK